MLVLTKPIVFFDLETTGLDTVNDRIISLGIVKINPDYQLELQKEFVVNPGVAIPEQASLVHGIYNDDVEYSPFFDEIIPELMNILDGSDIAGFNSNNFDVPMLYNELARHGYNWDYSNVNFIDVGNIYKIKESRTLGAAVKFYLNCEHENAHSAIADVIATAQVFVRQMQMYDDLPTSASEIAKYSNYGKPLLDLAGKFTYNDDGVVIFNFGKNVGQPATNHIDYLQWMINKGNFSEDTKRIAIGLIRDNSQNGELWQ